MKNKNKKVNKSINIGGSLLFYIFSFCLLAFYRGDFLFRLQELSIFLPTGDFFTEYMTKPAGFLLYISSFLLQFFYYPVLGAFIFTALLALLQYFVYKSFPFGRNFLLVSLLPSALILSRLTQLDHIIYVIPDQEFVYAYVLGVLFTLLLFLLYRNIKPFLAKMLYILLMTCIFYPLIGFYALISILLIAIYEIITSWKAKQSFILLVVSLLTVWCIPLFYYHFVYDVSNVAYLYFYGMLYPVVVLPVLLFLLPAFHKIKKPDEATAKTLILNILAWIVCLLIVVVFTYRDKNFDMQLGMERALGKNDFDKILKIADENKDVIPNRAIVQYRNIALFRKGQLLDKMFTYPNGSAEYKSDSLASVTIMVAHSVFYHSGRINFSYRWAMESVTKQGLSAEHLKYMAKAAMFNGETKLAEKYLNTLKQTLFHKKWAEENIAFLYNRNLFEQQEEYKKIYLLTDYDENSWENSDNVETSNLNFYSRLTSGTREMFDYSIAATLTLKDIRLFMNRFQVFLKINGNNKIPTHLQEAAMLFADLEKYQFADHVKFDQHIVNRYKDFHRMVNTIGADKMNEENSKRIQSKFGNTYWYYYFFSNNLKTN